jgi:hypothetical protein
MRRALSFLFTITAVAGCRADKPEPPRIPLAEAAAAAAPSGDALTGPVVEHLSAPPYMYLRVKTSKGDVWAAVPEARIENGAQVTVYGAMLMSNFESQSLKRTFKEVYFGTLTPPGAAPGATAAQPRGSPTAPPMDVGKVEKATGPDARTIAELWADKASLAGKSVTIRGVVVKYNGGVMGKNWFHLQDGSGDVKQGTNDIAVTSLDVATVGETIVIRGTVHTNRDFGAGYAYAVIVEDARIVRKPTSTF